MQRSRSTPPHPTPIWHHPTRLADGQPPPVYRAGSDDPAVTRADQRPLAERMVAWLDAHQAAPDPSGAVDLMDRFTDLVPELQTPVDVENLLTVIDAVQLPVPYLPLYEALFARVAELAISVPAESYLEVASTVPDLHNTLPDTVRTRYLVNTLKRLLKAIEKTAPSERSIAVNAYLRAARDDPAHWLDSAAHVLMFTLENLRGFLRENPKVVCAMEEAMFLHRTRGAHPTEHHQVRASPAEGGPAGPIDVPGGAAFPFHDLPDDLFGVILGLFQVDPFDVADRADTSARIATLGRLSAVDQGFHARLKDALQDAILCAIRVQPMTMTVWRDMKLDRPGSIVGLYLQHNPSVSSAQCIRWLVAGALTLPTPLACTRALELVQDIGLELQAEGVSPVLRAEVASCLPLLLVQGVMRGLAHTTDQSGRWVLKAHQLRGWLTTLPNAEAVPALLELLSAFAGPGSHKHSISGRWLNVWPSLEIEDLLQALAWPPRLRELLLRQQWCVAAVADTTRSLSGPISDDALIDITLETLSTHHHPFMGVTARALIALEKTPLTDTQAVLLAQCLANADARGPWRLLT